MEYYQKLERPVANESEAVSLKFGLTLQQIMDVVSFFCVKFHTLHRTVSVSISGREKSDFDNKCLAQFGKLKTSRN